MGVFKSLFRFFGGRKETPRTPAQEERIRRNQEALQKRVGNIPGVKITGTRPIAQEELAGRIGHIPGVRIPGVPPAEAERLRRAQSWTPWHPLSSTNIDRIRYLEARQQLQMVTKKGWMYQYEGVEPLIFQRWLETHSPGQFQWYVIRAYGYPYKLLSKGNSVSAPHELGNEGEVFQVSKEIEDFQRARGRSAVDERLPVAQGIVGPQRPYWEKFVNPGPGRAQRGRIPPK